MDAALVIDKPEGLTSHDVVNRVRRILKERSVGHLGTLDPMATGVLPLLVGRYTRLAQFFAKADKSYEGEIRLGFSTDTYDSTGKPTSDIRPVDVSVEQARAAASRFIGNLQQMPPPFSAKKIAGVPAYKLARKGQSPELKAVPIEIKHFEITAAVGDRLRFHVQVGTGTYIRTLAHELGRALGTGAHLAALRRTAAGQFGVDSAVSLDELEELWEKAKGIQCPITDIMTTTGGGFEYGTKVAALKGFVQSVELLQGFPVVSVDCDSARSLCNGRPSNLPYFGSSNRLRVFNKSRLVGIVERVAGSLFKPKVILLSLSDIP